MDVMNCDQHPPHLQPAALRQHPTRRTVRVLMLSGLVVLLGLGDLHNTLTMSDSVGMVELNPIAAYLLNANSTAGLVLYKLGTIGIAVGLVLKVRRHLVGELGAWILAGLMVGLILYWQHYTASITAELTSSCYHEYRNAMQAVASAAR
jgi:hypothetical protein